MLTEPSFEVKITSNIGFQEAYVLIIKLEIEINLLHKECSPNGDHNVFLETRGVILPIIRYIDGIR